MAGLQRELLDARSDERRFLRLNFSKAGISSSTLKWPELQTMAPSFIAAKCSRRMT